jgi:cobalt/nickel transport system ATP-binding protein
MQNTSEAGKVQTIKPTLSTVDVLFEIEQVSFSYETSQLALDQVSLDIQTGESAVILGANGSGKSTLLKLLDGLYFPQRGSIRAFGNPLTEQAFQDDEFNFAFRRKVGLVFQDSDVQLFSPSVLEEVAFAPLQLGLSRSEVEKRVDEALRALRIEKLRERVPHRLSGGEKRKVAIASILSLRPEVWLLDEPTSGLDPRSQSWLVEFILEQRSQGKSVVTATHDLSIVGEIATCVYVLNEDHRLVACGAPEEILQDHALLHACNLAHTHLPR